jgi:hypothetical protein
MDSSGHACSRNNPTNLNKITQQFLFTEVWCWYCRCRFPAARILPFLQEFRLLMDTSGCMTLPPPQGSDVHNLVGRHCEQLGHFSCLKP